ncbi:MAG: hypothetical protein MJ072_04575 [Clostridia bacterium]|nr:hypothetical protein [Clostridia bacterium]
MQSRSIKSVAKEAKKRLKSRFWEDYKREVESGVKKAGCEGVATSKVESYFKSRVVRTVYGESPENEKFYGEVKAMFESVGYRPHNALDILMDKKLFYTLTYENKEKYLFELSARYLSALERYDKERGVELCLKI